jgi:uncharacterized LabA/DUF88 family protein
MGKIAVLLDGGFVTKRHYEVHKAHATALDVQALVTRLLAKQPLVGNELFRVFYYDAPPSDERAKHPVTGATENFGATPRAARGKQLLSELELSEPYAVRKGITRMHGWMLKAGALEEIVKTKRAIAADDVAPNITQKGVDIKIGLDIAWIASKGLVDTMLLVTGDSDMIPAMKYARREGVRVVLATLGHSVFRDLRVHADYVLTDPA